MAIKSNDRGEVFVVDKDPIARRTLSNALARTGYVVTCFVDGDALLAATRLRCPACIILDVLPCKSGLKTLEELNARNYPVPVIIVSESGTIELAVSVIKGGAVDFIQKPIAENEIAQRVDQTVMESAQRRLDAKRSALPIIHGSEPLTCREREVLQQVVSGKSTKEVGQILGISHRTVEDHRANILKKVGAKNSVDLVRMVLA